MSKCRCCPRICWWRSKHSDLALKRVLITGSECSGSFDGKGSYDGIYDLDLDETEKDAEDDNGLALSRPRFPKPIRFKPVFKQRGFNRYLYMATDGRWCLSNAKNMSSRSAVAVICSAVATKTVCPSQVTDWQCLPPSQSEWQPADLKVAKLQPLDDVESKLKLTVHQLSGWLATLDASPTWTAADVKDALAEHVPEGNHISKLMVSDGTSAFEGSRTVEELVLRGLELLAVFEPKYF